MSKLPLPYQQSEESLTLRDYLAIDRTRLANDRTLLSFLRTGFSLVILAIALFEFTDFSLRLWTGFSLMGIGAVVMGIGIIRFRKVNKHLRSAASKS